MTIRYKGIQVKATLIVLCPRSPERGITFSVYLSRCPAVPISRCPMPTAARPQDEPCQPQWSSASTMFVRASPFLCQHRQARTRASHSRAKIEIVCRASKSISRCCCWNIKWPRAVFTSSVVVYYSMRLWEEVGRFCIYLFICLFLTTSMLSVNFDQIVKSLWTEKEPFYFLHSF